MSRIAAMAVVLGMSSAGPSFGDDSPGTRIDPVANTLAVAPDVTETPARLRDDSSKYIQIGGLRGGWGDGSTLTLMRVGEMTHHISEEGRDREVASALLFIKSASILNPSYPPSIKVRHLFDVEWSVDTQAMSDALHEKVRAAPAASPRTATIGESGKWNAYDVTDAFAKANRKPGTDLTLVIERAGTSGARAVWFHGVGDPNPSVRPYILVRFDDEVDDRAGQPMTYDFVAGEGDGLILDEDRSDPHTVVKKNGTDGVEVGDDEQAQASAHLRLADDTPRPSGADHVLILEYFDTLSRSEHTARAWYGGVRRWHAREQLDLDYRALNTRHRFREGEEIPSNLVEEASDRIYISSRPDAAEAYRQAQWRRNLFDLQRLLLDHELTDNGLTIRTDGRLILRSAELHPLDDSTRQDLDKFETRIEENYFRHLELVAEWARVDDSARIFLRARHYQDAREKEEKIARIETLRDDAFDLLRQAELAADRLYYEGRTAVAAGRHDAAQALEAEAKALVDAAKETTTRLDATVNEAFNGLQPEDEPLEVQQIPEHPAAADVPAFFRDRLRFFWFYNAGELPEHWARVGDIFGIEAVFNITTRFRADDRAPRLPSPSADHVAGDFDDPVDERLAETMHGDEPPPSQWLNAWEQSLDHQRRAVRHNAALGYRTVMASLYLHAVYNLGGIPAWLRDHGEEDQDIWDATHEGERNRTRRRSGTLNLFHPTVRQYGEDFAAAVGYLARREPGLIGFSTFNEMRWNRPGLIGYTDTAFDAFREHLEDEYQDLDQLNARWGTDYDSFDQITPPAPPEGISPVFYEWGLFREQTMRSHARDIHDAFKQQAPDAFTWYETMTDISDVGHTHVRAIPHVNTGNYNVRRLHGRTIADAETGSGGFPEQEGDRSARVTKAARERNLFDAMLMSHRGFTFWGRFFTAGSSGSRTAFHDAPSGARVLAPRDIGAIAVVRQKADRYNRLLLNTTVDGCGIGLVRHGSGGRHGLRAVTGNPRLRDNDRGLFTQLVREGYQPFYTAPNAILGADEELDEYRVLYFFPSPVVEQGLNERVLEWVEAGGTAILSGAWGLTNPYGEREGALVEAAFGLSDLRYPPDSSAQKEALESRRWRFVIDADELRSDVNVLEEDLDGNPQIIEAHLGRGSVVMTAASGWGHPPNHDRLTQVIRDALPPRFKRDAESDLRFIPRKDHAGGRYLGVINQSSEDTAEARLRIRGHHQRIVDLGIDERFAIPTQFDRATGTTDFHLRLEPGEGTILRLGGPSQ